jgi:hypothetical protein
MFPQLKNAWEDRDSGATFVLQEIEGFPFQKYSQLLAAYQEAEAWFTGEKLEEKNKNNDELYPLKVNPLIGTCMKHAYMLFGEPQDDGRPQVYPKMVARDAEQKENIKDAEYALNQVWSQSGGRALLIEAGILSQIYGGAVLKVNWNGFDLDPNNPFKQCRIENIPVTQFYGIPYPGDYYRLKEAWVIKKLEDSQAEQLGYTTTSLEDNWFVEYWNERTYYQKINNQFLTKEVKGVTQPLSGKNNWGFVPFFYIPHIRVGTFFGINTFDHILGLVREINLRYADYGDAVNDDSHSNLGMRNVSGSPKMRTIGGSLQVIDIGSSRNITGNEPEPDIFEVSKSNKASNAMGALADVLYDQYRRDAAHPAVADGEDEGSQRSGLTIAMRFWPMTSHISTERYFWTPALNKVSSAILQMLAKKKKGGITDEHLKLGIKQKWAPLLPRDREADVQEWVQRAASDIGSLETLLEQTGDIENIPDELKKILAWKKLVAEVEAKASAKFAPKLVQPGAKSGKTEKSDKTKPNSD